MANLHQRIKEFVKEAGYADKDGKMAFGATKYKYFKADDIMSAVRPHLYNCGLTIARTGVDIYNDEWVDPNIEALRANKDFKPKNLSHSVTLTCTFQITNVDDPQDYIEVQSVGSGIDTGDKASNKALTSALKYMLLDLAKIVDQEDDPDMYASDGLGVTEDDGKPAKSNTKPNKPSSEPDGEDGEEDGEPDNNDIEPEEKPKASKTKAATAKTNTGKSGNSEKLAKAAKKTDEELANTDDVWKEFKKYCIGKGIRTKHGFTNLCKFASIDGPEDSKVGILLNDIDKLDKLIEKALEEIPF